MTGVEGTFGALLVGGLVAAVFSGVVDVQCFAYFKMYPSDHTRIKVLVSAVWLLNLCHTICVSVSLWYYLIAHFGDWSTVQLIPWSLALTIAFTAILTFLVHCFFTQRIYKLSGDNVWIASLLGLLAVLRLGFACLTTAKLIMLKNLGAFIRLFRWSFTLGLALSSTLDILITGFLFYFLMRSRSQSMSMNRTIDTLILYTFENGSLTCAAVVASMLFWLAMPSNYVFLGIHFVISKFYANSLLATLNTRRQLRRGGLSMPSLSNVVFSDNFRSRRRGFLDHIAVRPPSPEQEPDSKSTMHISVEKKTMYTVDDSLPSPSSV